MKYITSDLAKVLGITTNTIRRYEESGFLSPNRSESNYRSYSDFDIKKAAAIRLYGKCGFTHAEINKMLGSSDEEINKIYQDKLDELDAQINRLTKLRHWLKDNKKMIHTAKTLDEEYILMKCPPVKYIIYSINNEILSEKKRLDSLKTFMYDAPEVQLIQVYRQEDFQSGKIIPHSGWAIKDVDIPKFHLEDFIATNPYIESYPQKECLYHVLRIPSNHINNPDAILQIRLEKANEVNHYIEDHNYQIDGDIMEFYVNAVGSTITLMECIPIKSL